MTPTYRQIRTGLRQKYKCHSEHTSFISTSFRHSNIPPEITDVILELWRPTTSLKYESVLRRWHSFAISRNENPCSPDVTAVLAFLHGMYHNGCLYMGYVQQGVPYLV